MFIHEKAGAHPSAVTKKRLLSGPHPFNGSKEMTGLKVTAGENHSICHGVVCRWLSVGSADVHWWFYIFFLFFLQAHTANRQRMALPRLLSAPQATYSSVHDDIKVKSCVRIKRAWKPLEQDGSVLMYLLTSSQELMKAIAFKRDANQSLGG